MVSFSKYSHIRTYLITYHKKQKLSERKDPLFTGFHLNVRKTFMAFASSVYNYMESTKEAIAKLNINLLENFRNLSKICKNCKTFLSLNFFAIYGIRTYHHF